jgi:hypothetical protein
MTDTDTTGGRRRGWREWFGTNRALRGEVEQLRREGEDLQIELATARAAYDSERAENGDLWGQLQDAQESVQEVLRLRSNERVDLGTAVEWERTNGDFSPRDAEGGEGHDRACRRRAWRVHTSQRTR